MKQSLSMLLMTAIAFLCINVLRLEGGEKTKTGWDAPISSDEAWELMPAPLQGERTELPGWVRLLAAKMPNTAAALIELDFAHRQLGPVDHKLRAAMHWVSAANNGCEYNMQIALGDALRSGEQQTKLDSLLDGSFAGWSEAEKDALHFAKQMTIASHEYSDAEFQELVDHFGAEQVGCMVLHLAYFNFHDRLMNVFGLQHDESDPVLAPIAVKFNFDPTVSSSGSKATSQASVQPTVTKNVSAKERMAWLGYDDLQKQLQLQRDRKPRLTPPDWSTIAPKLPAGLMDKPSDIVWYQLAFGYAAELAVPFEIYLREAGREVTRNWDRVFGGSIFWMVTNAIRCPYCMGHVEMNWEVAGLSKEDIVTRSRDLASGEWSMFTPAEQDALAFAKKLTLTPAEITYDDCQILREGFGEERAFYLGLNSSRYNYMTRISNGFQLNLEKENVFWDYYGIPKK